MLPLPLLLLPFDAPSVLVGYDPPAASPGVELGLFESKHELSEDELTVYVPLPPVPFPRLSPATMSSWVMPRTLGVHEKPVPVSVVVLMSAGGMAKESPPGMTPVKYGVLGSVR